MKYEKIENLLVVAELITGGNRGWDTTDSKGNKQHFTNQVEIEDFYGLEGWILSTIYNISGLPAKEFHFHRNKQE